MICLVQYLYWEAKTYGGKKPKDPFLKCDKCPFRDSCKEKENKLQNGVKPL